MTRDKVFADTFYWVAVLNIKDSKHFQALEIRGLLGEIIIVTTETVLIEVLNYLPNTAYIQGNLRLMLFGQLWKMTKSNTFRIRPIFSLKHSIFTKSVWTKVTV
jgi:hypothetical protein